MTGALLVLGAGEEQVAIYREARRRGVPTIGVDMRTDRPGVPLADEFLPISTTDHTRIAETLAGRHIAGVVSTAADTCLESWHHLATHFATPWRYPARAARVSMDKAEFHRVAAAAGIPAYRWIQSDRLDLVIRTARDFGFPVVLKPADASGSRGVHRADTPEELNLAVGDAARHSPRGQVIAEEYLAGRHFTVNVFMAGGQPALSLVSERQLMPGRRFLVGGHVAPAPLDPATEAAMLADAHRLCLAFDLTDGPANFDVIIKPGGTRYVIEVGARMSGNGFPRFAEAFSGVDWLGTLVDLATGQPIRPGPCRRRPTQLRILTSPLDTPGELLTIGGLARVAAVPGVVAVDVFASPGDTVHPFTEAGHKLGWLVVTADHPDQLTPTLGRALAELSIVVTPTGDPTPVPATA